MNLSIYFDEQPGPAYKARDALGALVGTSGDYLRMIEAGHRKPSPSLAKKIVTATKGKVTLHDLRPDIWDKPTRRGTAATQEKP